MHDGFIKVGCATPRIKTADPEYNAEQVIDMAGVMYSNGAKVIVFPELTLTGYTCNDLFLGNTLLEECRIQLKRISDSTEQMDSLIFVGLPMEYRGKLFNCAAVLHRGLVLAIVPKTFIPNYSEFYEARYFTPGFETPQVMNFYGCDIPFGTHILFDNGESMDGLSIAAEICEDAWVPCSPATSHVMAGATLIVNLSASDEVIGKKEYREMLIASTSARLVCGYVYTSAGEGESTQDLVFGGHDIIAENGKLLKESELFSTGAVYGDIDMGRIASDRRRMNTFNVYRTDDYMHIPFLIDKAETKLSRIFERTPFVPDDSFRRAERCEEIFNIQSMGLKKRLEHIKCRDAVIGISGGLDSTLALLVTVRAFDMSGIDRRGIHCITMPCFGTTDRTYENACKLVKAAGASLTEIDIKEAVNIHFKDIAQDDSVHDITYENCQARERTQILMDIANKDNGIVIGTGDMSELALGWATYNGDHMSMYGVNAGVPKTLVRHLVQYRADIAAGDNDSILAGVLEDIINTPVSPELLPPEDGRISQKTEDIVGPYELHDFFLYYLLRFGFGPKKIYRMAVMAFEGRYDKETVLKWLRIFFSRFFSQQFKRSCMPDGPKVGTAALSPRGDLRMPSDASSELWMKEIDEINIQEINI